MHDLTAFTFRDVTEASATVRKMGTGAKSMEEVADRIVAYFQENLADSKGGKSCALVRFFKTHPYQDLSEDLQRFARSISGGPPPTNHMRCLVLMATTGIHANWNSRHKSAGHQAIPMHSLEAIAQGPMFSSLVRQFGLQPETLVEPSPELMLNLAERILRIFHVPEARGSACVPDQDNFVEPFGIRSLVGFGGVLPTGNLFAVILFSKTPISRDTAQLFGSLALSTKVAVLPFEQSVFR